ncbi:MAG: homoserine O-acetyltransferase [Lentisphaerae bacterium]|jgi:homoserine O-acetyltransferase|nr:homoserine O-acetyltransferase [Lentisphaerota bacterium]
MNSDSRQPKPRSLGVIEPQTLRLDLPPEGFVLELGGVLKQIDVTYEICGEMNADGSNIIYICHALTGDAHVAGIRPGEERPDGWWEGMVGPGKGIDTDYYCVICSNMLAGCKGTTGPSSTNPDTGEPYGSTFPSVTVRDMVDVQYRLLRQLGIKRLVAVIGGSFGGMQVLDWATRYPDYIGSGVVIAAAASLNAQALAFDIIGRRAITEDPRWKLGNYYGSMRKPKLGLGQARRLAHITYLSESSMADKFGRARRQAWIDGSDLFKLKARLRFRTTFEVESYLDHQARKFINRFDANSYLHITRAMDEYDLCEQYGSLEKAFEAIKAPMLIVSLSGDWLFTPEQSEEMVRALMTLNKPVSYFHLRAPAGHDAFLTHIDELAPVVRAFLPWIGERVEPEKESVDEQTATADALVARTVAPGSRLLDLGCGNGRLLQELKERRQTVGTGVEINLAQARTTLDRGFDVILVTPDGDGPDEERGLALIPDDSFDTVVLSETLQETRRPLRVLEEVLRIAPQAIITFPNFGYLTTRLKLLFTGRMPVNRHLPNEWYDTPNIHLCTYRDFIDLCRRERIVIRKVHHLTTSLLGRLLIAIGWPNAGAERVIVQIARDKPEPPEQPHEKMA